MLTQCRAINRPSSPVFGITRLVDATSPKSVAASLKMTPTVLLSFAIALQLVYNIHGEISCKNMAGKPVDWYVLLKQLQKRKCFEKFVIILLLVLGGNYPVQSSDYSLLATFTVFHADRDNSSIADWTLGGKFRDKLEFNDKEVLGEGCKHKTMKKWVVPVDDLCYRILYNRRPIKRDLNHLSPNNSFQPSVKSVLPQF